ncbi:MAG: ABC transporter ATP-binding protein [Candidatus Omnitrophota bacterium]
MIKIENISKKFGNHIVLDKLNLEIKDGETLVIIGRSGCGKSVLLKHIVGLLIPDNLDAKVIVDGVNITKLTWKELNEIRNKFGVVFQGGALFDSLSVGENVGFKYLEYSNIPRDELYKKVEEALHLVDLSGIQNVLPSELSGGMRKRAALARAICLKPEIILYDEPTTGVDPITADSINELIRSMHDQLKVTSIVVTHDMVSAYKIADRIVMLYKGKIIAEGTPREIQNTTHPVVKQFITGSSHGPITETIDGF